MGTVMSMISTAVQVVPLGRFLSSLCYRCLGGLLNVLVFDGI